MRWFIPVYQFIFRSLQNIQSFGSSPNVRMHSLNWYENTHTIIKYNMRIIASTCCLCFYITDIRIASSRCYYYARCTVLSDCCSTSTERGLSGSTGLREGKKGSQCNGSHFRCVTPVYRMVDWDIYTIIS